LSPMRSVVVTGASTGIGRATALHLAAKGQRVFAGVRKDSDGAALTRVATGVLEPLIIDVGEQSSIDAAAKTIDGAVGVQGLSGLVNNAGVAISGPLEYLPIDDLRRQLEVNVIGQIAVTQALLPLIREAEGRIVNIGSVAGRAPSAPLLGPYAASKMAMEALTDSMRAELKPWGIFVSIIEPGNIATRIWEKADSDFDRLESVMPEEGLDRYAKLIAGGRRIAKMADGRGIPPERVARVVERALTARRPKSRYLVGWDAWARAHVEANLPDRVRDGIVVRVLRRIG
jgi:NAD(P)-dependent dehydrogenase (short-subunit alcohol dehydrogenase family)